MDHTGTTRLTDEQSGTIAEARDGVEIYFTTTGLDYRPV